MSSNKNRCPICNTDVDTNNCNCAQCGWDFTPVLGSDSAVITAYKDKMKAYKAQWQLKLSPKTDKDPLIERDPFETNDEWKERIDQSNYLVGDVELIKSKYDIATGYFPVTWQSQQKWFEDYLLKSGSKIVEPHLKLPRDKARKLYDQSSTWSVQATFLVFKGTIYVAQLVLLTKLDDGETYSIQFTIEPNKTVIGRYFIDNNDGTATDTRNGLTWMRCGLDEEWDEQNKRCTGKNSYHVYQEALQLIIRLNYNGGFANKTDWRIPTDIELKTILKDNADPGINTKVFPSDHLGYTLAVAATPIVEKKYYFFYVEKKFWIVDLNYSRCSEILGEEHFSGFYNKSGYGRIQLVRSGS